MPIKLDFSIDGRTSKTGHRKFLNSFSTLRNIWKVAALTKFKKFFKKLILVKSNLSDVVLPLAIEDRQRRHIKFLRQSLNDFS